MTIAERSRSNAWLNEVKIEDVGDVPTMLSSEERLMLHWFGREMNIENYIVDGGCFLGGSTLSLATGIASRADPLQHRKWIHTYDMFRAPRDGYSLSLIKTKKAGASVLDLFEMALGQHLPMIQTYVGDILQHQPPPGAIDLLFIDVAKSKAIARHFAQSFFRRLIPGRSIVIQQDYNDASCPWVNVQMEYFKDHFEYITDQNGGSRVYLFTNVIPDETINRYQHLSLDDEIIIQNSAIDSSHNTISRFWNSVTLGWLIFERDTAEASIPYMESLRDQQPWEGASYVDYVIAGMRAHGTQANLDAFYIDAFKPMPT